MFDSIFPGGWSTTDKIAVGALCVAIISLLVSIIPAISSIVQARAAGQALKAEREAREPAINVSARVWERWPPGFIQINLSVTNRSDFFIEVRRVRITAPRGLRLAYIPEPFFPPKPPPPVDPTTLAYSRASDTGNTLVRYVGCEGGPNSLDFPFAIAAPRHKWRALRLKMKVDIARTNRHLASTTIPVHLDVSAPEWTDFRA